MRAMPTPKIDPRRVDELLHDLIRSIPLHSQEWKEAAEIPAGRHQVIDLADDPQDFGMGLLKLAARMGEVIIEQLNRVPEKNFLAFLDLVGIDLLPPKGARAPLTFVLAEKAPDDGLVPKGTKVGVKNLDDVIFETEEDLVVSRASLKRVYSLSPEQDRYADLGELLRGASADGKAIFRDPDPVPAWPLIEHLFYLGHARLFTLAETAGVPVTITIASPDEGLGPLLWEYSGKGGWTPAPSTPTNDLTVTLNLSGIQESVVEGYDRQGNLIKRSSYWIRAKAAQPLSADPTQLPTASAITAEVNISKSGLLPDLAFFNNLPIDLSKDFFPFGERPKFNDIFSIAGHEAFSKAGAQITIDVKLSDTPPRPDTKSITLIWEYRDGEKWVTLAQTTQDGIPTATNDPYQFTDTTNAFTKDGQIKFRCPPIKPATWNGEDNYWTRVRIVAGDYGREAEYQKTASTELETELRRIETDSAKQQSIINLLNQQGLLDSFRYIPATFKPPSLKSLTAAYSYTEAAQSDLTIITVNDFVYQEVSSAVPFKPFVLSQEKYPTLYLGFDEAKPFKGSPLSLYFQVIQPRYGKEQNAGVATPIGSPPVVVWRYWDGKKGWSLLPLEDETHDFTEGGRARFVGPYGASGRHLFGERLHWIKASVEKGWYARTPSLQGIHPNTVWAIHGVTLMDQILGSSSGEPDQSLNFAKTPVLSGEVIEIREPALPSEAERRRLIAEEGEDAIREVRDGAGNITEVWVRWHPVDALNLSRPSDRHYVIDRVKGLLLFGDGVRGLIPPPGKDNIRAAKYRSGGGKIGNHPAGAITELKTTIPFVDAVVNHQASAGGLDQEDLEAAMIRGPRHIKSRDLAITIEDFEWLAYHASGDIARTRCLPMIRVGPAGLQPDSPGWVTLIVVPEGEEDQPTPTEGLIQTVKDYLAQRALVTMARQIDVIGPAYTPVTVEATIVPKRIEEAKVVEKRVFENLRAFLHPVKGGPEGKGWEFGKNVYLSEIAAVIQGTEGVDSVREISLGAGREKIEIPKNGLPSAGEHIIRSVGR